ncbi:MAG: hypothetical protein KDD48_02805 [Bdellovibrionales bacterium]|nr:hypothetical protein [Bdellovibrionales bacterium]
MKIICSPSEKYLNKKSNADLRVFIYGHTKNRNFATCGDSIRRYFKKKKINLKEDAWDFLSFAISVVACDLGATRKLSPDGWTRHIELEIAVNNPDKWNREKNLIEQLLRFLSTDIWQVKFIKGGFKDSIEESGSKSDASCVSLISGGLDSLIGAIDLVNINEKPLFISQIVHGDRQKQSDFVAALKKPFEHIQINHSFRSPLPLEPSQRARSIIFLSYGIVAATLLKKYENGKEITLYVCENGLISLNPALTEARIGSLSTRTTHPYFLEMLRELVKNLGFNINIENPYQFKTKGEMLSSCKDQFLLRKLAHKSTSCGRFTRNAFTHCGRCIPCLIRRASFVKWGNRDSTTYKYKNLRLNDPQHAGFDDVRSAVLAIQSIQNRGFSAWFGSASSVLPENDRPQLRSVVERGMKELQLLLNKFKLC